MKYELKLQIERVGDLKIRLQCIRDLNKTIDSLFEELEKSGNLSLLEELCPYFGVVWPSARALAEVLAEMGQNQLAGTSLMEMGCGLALPSFVAAKHKARVIATDFHPEVSKFLERNAFLNQVSSFNFVHLDWRKTDQKNDPKYIDIIYDSAGSPILQDWIIGSDVLYEKEQVNVLSKAIDKFLAPGGKAIISDPERPYLQSFIDEMHRLGFCSKTDVRTVFVDSGFKDIFVVHFSRGTI